MGALAKNDNQKSMMLTIWIQIVSYAVDFKINVFLSKHHTNFVYKMVWSCFMQLATRMNYGSFYLQLWGRDKMFILIIYSMH